MSTPIWPNKDHTHWTLDLTGLKFGRLEVIKLCPSIKNHQAWECRCDCGVTCNIRAYSLKSGNTKSCGCRSRQATRLPPGEAAFNIVFRRYRTGARIRKLEFSLTRQQFRSITLKNCHYCNQKPRNCVPNIEMEARKLLENNTASGIDRKDNSKGYTLENSLPCCKTCNLGKHTLGYEEWIEHLTNLTKFRTSIK